MTGAVGAIVFSVKIARSPVRRVGVIRELPDSMTQSRASVQKSSPVAFEMKMGRMLERKDVGITLRKSKGKNADIVLRTFLSSGSTSLDRAQLLQLWNSSPEDISVARRLVAIYGTLPPPAAAEPNREIEDKVKDLEKRLRRLESESLRKVQEKGVEAVDEKSEYVQ